MQTVQKNPQRNNKRLKERARHLSEEDMVQILVMKHTKEEHASSSTSTSDASSCTVPLRSGVAVARTTASASVHGEEDKSTDHTPSDDEIMAED